MPIITLKKITLQVNNLNYCYVLSQDKEKPNYFVVYGLKVHDGLYKPSVAI